jgi:hypothetical protein
LTIRQAISEKIKSLDFSDCKVRVLNVDSQASFNNIVVQVIGEMSNKSEPHHKFVQTFVLAEQPNGYFVLNDIFRYLSDDEDEIVDDEPTQAEVPAEEAPTPAEGLNAVEPHTEDQVTTEDAAEAVDEKLEEEKAEVPQEETGDTNGTAASEEPVESSDRVPVEDVVAGHATETEHAPAEATPEAEISQAPTEPASEPTTSAPVPAPEKKAAPKTWASMLGGGAAAAQKPAVPALPLSTNSQAKPARPAQSTQAPRTAAPATDSNTTNAPTTSTTPVAQSNGWQMAGHDKKNNRPQNRSMSEGTTMAYIKNVNEKVDARLLREALESCGELKYFDVSRPRVSFVLWSTPWFYH